RAGSVSDRGIRAGSVSDRSNRERGIIQYSPGERFLVALQRLGKLFMGDMGPEYRAAGAGRQAMQVVRIELQTQGDREEGDPSLDHVLDQRLPVGRFNGVVGALTVAQVQEDALARFGPVKGGTGLG